MKRIFQITALSLCLALPAAAETWYQNCRDRVPVNSSCAQAYNSISVCCRHKYDGCKASQGAGCAGLFSGCVTDNATQYTKCTAAVTGSHKGTDDQDLEIARLVIYELLTLLEPPAKE